MAQSLRNIVTIVLLSIFAVSLVINAKSLPDSDLFAENNTADDGNFDQIDISETSRSSGVLPQNKLDDASTTTLSEASSLESVSQDDAETSTDIENLKLTTSTPAAPISTGQTVPNANDDNHNGTVAETSTRPATSTKRPDFFLIESSTKPPPCVPHSCDAESTLMVTLEPVGNDTGFVSRALGLPVHFDCALYTQGRRVRLPVEWKLPNGTQIVNSDFELDAVKLQDSGDYVCTLMPTECCSHVTLSATVHLRVYELSETAGILLMLSVLASIVILVGVFCYSQKKKQYHAWLKHEMLAASTSSADIVAHSSLRQDLDTNSKKYLLNN